jgi:hypothetical protein
VKTHELANALRLLAKMLEDGPNTQVSEMNKLFGRSMNKPDANQVAVNLQTLMQLSKIEKQQWKSLIYDDYGFKINITPRDSSRDILGKLLKYLEDSPNAIAILKQRTKRSDASGPSALSLALEALLKGTEK